MRRRGGNRSKSGCLTCRRRHKKCDERKPNCWNCERNNLACDGYSTPIKWKPLVTSDIHRSPSPQDASLHDRPSSPSPTASGQNSDTISTHHPSPQSSAMPFLIPHVRNSKDTLLLQYFIEVVSHVLVFSSDKTQNPLNQLILPLSFSDEDNWGLFDIIISLSACHRIRTLSADSSNSLTSGEIRSLEQTKWDRYGRAITNHSRNLSCLMKEPIDRLTCIDYAIATTMLLCRWSTCEKGDTSTWTLHLTATGDLVSRKLDSLVRRNEHEPTAPGRLGNTSQMLLEWFYFCDTIATVTDMERRCFLDAHGLAADKLLASFARREPSGIFWIGPNDGLLRLLIRTLALRRASTETSHVLATGGPEVSSCIPEGSQELALRAQTPSSPGLSQNDLTSTLFFGHPSTVLEPSLLVEAISIENALRDWSFEYSTPQQATVASAYRWAVFLLLLFTIYPHSPVQAQVNKVQHTLHTLGHYIRAISTTDSAQISALFPLFIYGVSAFCSDDQNLVIDKVTAYGQWAGLGHVDDIICFLQDWWAERDGEGSGSSTLTRDWWGWERFLKPRHVQLILV